MASGSNTSTRRNILKAGAAIAALAVPATALAAAAPDPIYAAIEAHRRVWNQLSEAVRVSDRAFHEHGWGSDQYEAAQGPADTLSDAVDQY
jgi:hypothetical protein